ncbi:PDZ domain-containing protein [Tautonia plasticadhaerens]|uniref:PDZ domain (Also known as DHR or GLGF) n=1 Tax=Tautonia plasticadhaerens TaxID=2527974 RepID=A0A518H905_9BACT|nr:PDZ domain-containing protein [Tautonia plasticadhaerens]QDV37324.1 PDZ domain (Also known as DHR or GLGF) [Tautonia plasticadhaerens]
MSHSRRWKPVPLLAIVALAASPAAEDGQQDEGRQIGRSFRVPYLLTETNHHVVRCRINGHGPFNLVVDTGAPALFLSEEAAAMAGLGRSDRNYFSRVDRLEFEGGAVLDDVQTRVEDIFQLVGMNALGLPGAKIDGMLGFNVLARYKLELDPTDDRMTWTRLEFEPEDLPDPGRRGNNAPAEVQAMSLLGGVAKLAALFVGKQPEDTRIPRGFLGLELAETNGEVTISAVLPGSPAEGVGISPGDRLVRVLGRDVDSLEDARKAVARVEPGDTVTLRIAPSSGGADVEARELTVIAGKGL